MLLYLLSSWLQRGGILRPPPWPYAHNYIPGLKGLMITGLQKQCAFHIAYNLCQMEYWIRNMACEIFLVAYKIWEQSYKNVFRVLILVISVLLHYAMLFCSYVYNCFQYDSLQLSYFVFLKELHRIYRKCAKNSVLIFFTIFQAGSSSTLVMSSMFTSLK